MDQSVLRLYSSRSIFIPLMSRDHSA